MSSLIFSCGDDGLDPSLTVSLIVDQDWSDQELQAIENAAESWNLEFGTRVRLDPDAPLDEQSAPISFSDDACVNENGEVTHGRASIEPLSITICTHVRRNLLLLFETVRHEIGHVLGIPVHARDGFAVMTGRATELAHWFRDPDRALFHRVNPDFSGESGCALSPLLTHGKSMLAHPADFPIHVLWAVQNSIRFAPLDPSTAAAGPEAGRIEMIGKATDLDAQTTSDGFLVTWIEKDRIAVSAITLPGGLAGRQQTAQIDWPSASSQQISAVGAAPFYWVALTVRAEDGSAPPMLRLLQMDEASGAIIASTSLAAAFGRVLLHDDQVFVVTGELDLATAQTMVRVRSVKGGPLGFSLSEPLDIAAVPISLDDGPVLPEPILAARSFRSGLMLLLETSSEQGSISLIRISTDGGLAIDQTATLDSGRFSDPALIEAGEHVFVAGSRLQPDHYVPELYVAQLAAGTLSVERDWRRLSAPDSLPVSSPRLAVEGDHLVSIWLESPDDDVRSRCLAIE